MYVGRANRVAVSLVSAALRGRGGSDLVPASCPHLLKLVHICVVKQSICTCNRERVVGRVVLAPVLRFIDSCERARDAVVPE